MKKFREYISEEVVPSALVANGTIDIDNEDVRASINLALAKVTSDGAITPYIALNRISKALSYFHIILPKRIYLEGAKGVEVHEIRQFGHKMGMTDQGEFVHEVPGKYYLFMQYNMNSPMPYGGQLAYPNMGGTFRVMAKVVDKVELDRLVSMAELALAEECDAEMQQKRAKHSAPHETMHDVTSDEKKKGNKAAVADSEKGLDEAKAPWEKEGNWSKQMKRQEREFRRASTRTKVKLNPEKEISHTVHDVGPGGKKTLSQSGKMKVKDLGEGWVALGPRGASSVYDKFGDVRPGTKWYGRRPPKANKPGDAEPGAGDTYKGSKQGGKTRFAKSVKEDKDPCWKGYEMVGMKKKRGRNVPNCVPVKEGIADTLRSMNPFAKAADALGTSSAKAAPDTRIMGNPDTQKKQPPKEGSPQSSFPSVNEGQIDEISQQLTGRYRSLAGTDLAHRTSKALLNYQADKPVDKENRRKSLNRVTGIRRADKRFKEETQLDEISKGLAGRYKDRAHASYTYSAGKRSDDEFVSGPGKKMTDASGKPKFKERSKEAQKADDKTIQKRLKGLGMAHKRLAKEETQIDELSKNTLKSYKKAAESDKRSAESSAETSRMHRKNRALPLAKRNAFHDEEKWLKGIAKKREKGIAMADKRLEENLGKAMKKYKAWTKTAYDDGDPRNVKKRLKNADSSFVKRVADQQGKLGGAAELQRRLAKRMSNEETISEKAPPGAKYERMVKHIKAGYAKDGLTKKEKGIAYATAWKAKKRESED